MFPGEHRRTKDKTQRPVTDVAVKEHRAKHTPKGAAIVSTLSIRPSTGFSLQGTAIATVQLNAHTLR